MEPFTVSALVLSFLGIFGRADKQDARDRRNAAARRAQSAANDARNQAHATSDSAVALVRERIATAAWMYPRVIAAFEKHNESSNLFGGATVLFAGRTREQVEHLIRKARACFPTLEFKGDAAVLALGSTALLLKGIQHLDGAGILSVPVLHGTVADAVCSIPWDGADTLAHSLGTSGAVAVADVVADTLVIFGVLRLVHNISSASSLSKDARRLDEEAGRLREKSAELNALQVAINQTKAEQDEATYLVFRATLIADAVFERASKVPSNVKERAMRGLRTACLSWWNALQKEPQPT